MNALDFVRNLYSDIDARIDRVRGFRAVAQGAETAGLIAIKRIESTVADGEAYARLAGFVIANQDDVLCLETRGGRTVVLGKLQNTTATAVSVSAGLIGEVLQFQASQDAADNASTTNTGTYVVAITTGLVLPAGTWSVRVAFEMRATHGVSGNVSLKVNVGGTASGASWTGGSLSAARTLAAPSTAPGAWVGTATTLAGISGGTVNVFGGYISSGGNTATANGPRLLIDATRTA